MARNPIKRRLSAFVGISTACAAMLVPAAANAAPPANDAFADAAPVASMPFSESIDITESTSEPGERSGCMLTNGTVWYRIEPAESRTMRVSFSGPFTLANVYSQRGVDMSGLLPVASCIGHGQQVLVQAAAGETLYVQVVRDPFFAPGPVQLDIDAVQPPPNDAFAAAKTVPALPFTETVETSVATVEPDEPPMCTSPASERTAWYTYTPSANESLTARSNSVLAVYAGPSLEALTLVDCRQSAPVTFAAQAGTTYYVQVGLPGSEQGHVQFNLEVAPPLSVSFFYFPQDPSGLETVNFSNWSFDPAGSPLNVTWDFGDGSVSSDHHTSHRYGTDGDYTARLTVTTPDGRTASTSQDVHVRTHDVQITKFVVPNKATAGQTARITIGVTNSRYTETVDVTLFKSVPGGDFVLVGSGMQSVPARGSNRTTDYRIDYTFTADDAAATRVTFRAVVTIQSHRDALPADNTALSFPVIVRP